MSTLLQSNISGPPPAAMECLKLLLSAMVYLRRDSVHLYLFIYKTFAQAPAISSNYKAPSAASFVTPQSNNNNLNGFTSQDSYRAQNRPNRDNLRV